MLCATVKSSNVLELITTKDEVMEVSGVSDVLELAEVGAIEKEVLEEIMTALLVVSIESIEV